MLRFVAAVLAMAAACAVSSAKAHEYTVGSLKIGHPWTRATPKGATVAGGYLTVTNTGSTSDRLIGGSLEGADRAEIHVMRMDNGVMTMRPLAGGIEIKPGETVKLEPGGYHLMFIGLKASLQQGSRVKGTLVFAKAGTVAVEFAVEGLGAMHGADDHAMPGMRMNH